MVGSFPRIPSGQFTTAAIDAYLAPSRADWLHSIGESET
jgi:hypothetical protein